MTFEVISTLSWNVLGTFEDEAAAQQAVSSSLTEGGARPADLVVYVTDDAGHEAGEIAEDELVAWSGADTRTGHPVA